MDLGFPESRWLHAGFDSHELHFSCRVCLRVTRLHGPDEEAPQRLDTPVHSRCFLPQDTHQMLPVGLDIPSRDLSPPLKRPMLTRKPVRKESNIH